MRGWLMTTGAKRSGLAAALVAGALAWSPAAGEPSSSASSAMAFIEEFSQRSLKTLTNESLSGDALRSNFTNLYDEAFDNRVVSRFIFGRHWRKASRDERSDFRRLFRSYIINLYASRFRTYSGAIKIDDARAGGDDGIYIVGSTFISDGQRRPVPVNWRVGYADGAYRIYDLNIAGVSLAITQRSEIDSLVRNNGNSIAAMLDVLRSKSEQLSGAAPPGGR